MLSNVFDPSLLPCIKYLYSCMFKTARHAFLPQLGPGSFYYCLIYLSKMALMFFKGHFVQGRRRGREERYREREERTEGVEWVWTILIIFC